MGDHGAIVVLGEPDQATGALYQRALDADFTVLVAPDEASVLDALRAGRVAAVVIEPALFGAQIWEQLAALSRACAAARVPLVICSTQDERRRGRELGAAAYLVKPTLPSTLLATVRHVLDPTAA